MAQDVKDLLELSFTSDKAKKAENALKEIFTHALNRLAVPESAQRKLLAKKDKLLTAAIQLRLDIPYLKAVGAEVIVRLKRQSQSY